MKFGQFSQEQSDEDRLDDQVTSAMETGNIARARELVAAHRETFPDAVLRIQRDVIRTYGVRL